MTGAGSAIPARVCERCGEYLPHYCAPVITIKRQPFTGLKIVRIEDRVPVAS